MSFIISKFELIDWSGYLDALIYYVKAFDGFRVTIVILFQQRVFQAVIGHTSASEFRLANFVESTWHANEVTVDASTLTCAPNTSACLCLPFNVTRWIFRTQLLVFLLFGDGNLDLFVDFFHIISFGAVNTIESSG